MAMKFLKNLFGTDEENEGFYEDDDDESYVDTSSNAVTNEEAYASSSYSEPKSSYSSTSGSSSKFVNIGTNSSGSANIKILKPSCYEDIFVAVDLIRDGTAVFVCLNGLPNDACIRVVDFLTGVTAALYGGCEKVDSYCYLARPKNFNLIGSID